MQEMLGTILYIVFFISICITIALVKRRHTRVIYTLDKGFSLIRSAKALYLKRVKRPLSHQKGKWLLVGVMGVVYTVFTLYVYL
jgi:hypothetical protein